MAIAVLDVDFENMPPHIGGLERYRSALLLLRLGGRPVGQALLRVESGRAYLRRDLPYAADSGFWEAWLRAWLGMEADASPAEVHMPISVAVCTRDRPQDVQRCLAALTQLPDEGQEIIVIDNCPATDATRRVVAAFPGVRYVREARPGLNVARNRALREARYEVIAFCDDDAAPDAGWLRALRRNFSEPDVLCVTGLTMPLELETPAQEFFQRSGGLGRGFKRVVFDGARHDPLLAWHAGAGVNMAVRACVAERVGGFDERLDAGTPIGGGGDTDLFRRILSAGYRIVYDPEALNWHCHRRSWKALRRQLGGYEAAHFAVLAISLFRDRELTSLVHARDWLRHELRGVTRAVVRRPGSSPVSVSLARFLGGVAGPFALLRSHLLHLQRRKGG